MRSTREMLSDPDDGPTKDDLIPDPPGPHDPDLDAVYLELYGVDYDPDDPRIDPF